ncbi:NAD(P)/FAD-dependent oxidoreductase (plasmid) [Nicoliella spurrieriana]|uniref:NAD(P)/FAD-dependent oxidoreductase n=1 Tax=Nicoliella spurrieriana TaxID=2925830 RepID=A0A976X4W8_9LACO|nr:NAD(P)/FAD-dependent oxidoreductase [Nicoliella spurrieriana]UQS86189.1 NAD(P)/FAD-dependent oxidoreductase [Nicoliella spurrieriana]
MSNQYDYDVIYLGGGVGAVNGAVPLGKHGYKAAIIESTAIGGTCPNFGCTPKFTLDVPAELAYRTSQFQTIYGGNKLKVDWYEDMQRKHRNIDADPAGGMKKRLKAAGVDVIHGYGKLVDNHTLAVNGKHLTTDKIVIATGLTPNHIDVPGTELTHDSTHFLSIDHLPKRLTVIGSGYVAIELATIANEAGADVTILMHRDRVLRGFDSFLVDKLVNSLKQRGMHFVPNSDIKAIETHNDELVVKYQDQKLATDYILDASGRNPVVHNIGLEEVGVEYDEHGIKVNDHLQTSVDNIYADGDVINLGKPELSPVATFESKYLTKQFIGETTAAIEFPPMPTNVFASPRLASVGVNPEAVEQDANYRVQRSVLSGEMYYKASGQTVAARTLVFDKDDFLVGASELSDQAEDAIEILNMVISWHISRKQIQGLINIFPSLGSNILTSF